MIIIISVALSALRDSWRCSGSLVLVLVKLPAGGRLFEKSRRRDVVDRGAAAGGGAGGRGAGRGAASVRARVKGLYVKTFQIFRSAVRARAGEGGGGSMRGADSFRAGPVS